MTFEVGKKYIGGNTRTPNIEIIGVDQSGNLVGYSLPVKSIFVFDKNGKGLYSTQYGFENGVDLKLPTPPAKFKVVYGTGVVDKEFHEHNLVYLYDLENAVGVFVEVDNHVSFFNMNDFQRTSYYEKLK